VTMMLQSTVLILVCSFTSSILV